MSLCCADHLAGHAGERRVDGGDGVALDLDTSVTTERPHLGVRAALLVLRGYKVLLSPFFAGSCRYLPSCADYAAEAIGVHGLFRGVGLAARRLARCHPLGRSGHDPVPPRQAASRHPATGRAR
jgi:putative membrane protein insertion efficiency factor